MELIAVPFHFRQKSVACVTKYIKNSVESCRVDSGQIYAASGELCTVSGKQCAVSGTTSGNFLQKRPLPSHFFRLDSGASGSWNSCKLCFTRQLPTLREKKWVASGGIFSSDGLDYSSGNSC